MYTRWGLVGWNTTAADPALSLPKAAPVEGCFPLLPTSLLPPLSPFSISLQPGIKHRSDPLLVGSSSFGSIVVDTHVTQQRWSGTEGGAGHKKRHFATALGRDCHRKPTEISDSLYNRDPEKSIRNFSHHRGLPRTLAADLTLHLFDTPTPRPLSPPTSILLPSPCRACSPSVTCATLY